MIIILLRITIDANCHSDEHFVENVYYKNTGSAKNSVFKIDLFS